jgi:hypothetical protein
MYLTHQLQLCKKATFSLNALHTRPVNPTLVIKRRRDCYNGGVCVPTMERELLLTSKTDRISKQHQD